MGLTPYLSDLYTTVDQICCIWCRLQPYVIVLAYRSTIPQRNILPH